MQKMETNNTMKGAIRDLELGGEVFFPIEHVESIRVYACNIGAILGRRYKTSVHRELRSVSVTRLS